MEISQKGFCLVLLKEEIWFEKSLLWKYNFSNYFCVNTQKLL